MWKDFAFPGLLALFGAAVSIVSVYMGTEGTARRLWWTVAATCVYLAVISYIWGDPVRGPFYGLVHPKKPDTFTVHAVGRANFSIKQLSRGIDFSQVIKLPNRPVKFVARRTWWAGWNCDLSIAVLGEDVELMHHNEVSSNLPPQFDLNFDDRAIEVIEKDNEKPFLQIIQDGDYDIWINTMLVSDSGKGVIITKNGAMRTKAVGDLQDSDFPKRLFKYPSYANRGRRD